MASTKCVPDMEAVSFMPLAVPAQSLMFFLTEAGERSVARLELEGTDTTRSGARRFA